MIPTNVISADTLKCNALSLAHLTNDYWAIVLAALHFRKNIKDWVLPLKILFLNKKKNALRKLFLWSSWDLLKLFHNFYFLAKSQSEIWDLKHTVSWQHVWGTPTAPELWNKAGACAWYRTAYALWVNPLTHKTEPMLAQCLAIHFLQFQKTLEISPTLKRFFFPLKTLQSILCRTETASRPHDQDWRSYQVLTSLHTSQSLMSEGPASLFQVSLGKLVDITEPCFFISSVGDNGIHLPTTSQGLKTMHTKIVAYTKAPFFSLSIV